MKTKSFKILTVIALLTSVSMGVDRSIESSEKPLINAKKTVKPYLLKTCIVSDEELGSMGEIIRFEYKNQEIKLCCKTCVKTFKKNADAYLKLIEEKTKKQK